MCGIGGIIFEKKSVDNNSALSKIEVIRQNQHLRGPDASAIFTDTRAYLVHNRLSIIDLNSTGNQPMEFKSWVVVFNGEIYNYRELKEKLLLKNHTFSGESDTEVLIHLIDEYGVSNAVKMINGIFAICAYNLSTGDTYLIRDRMGEKPLFYYFDKNNTLFFASNPSSIVKCLPEMEWKLDSEAAWEYFSLGGIISEKTLFSGIKRLDAAMIMQINGQSSSFSKYWTPVFHKRVTLEQINSQIRSSIISRTVSDVPIVLFLSGGVDSSTVASVIKKLDAVHLISSEVNEARSVAKLFSMDFNVLTPHDFDISNSLLEYSNFSGEPTMAGFIPYIASKEASKKYKVALSANGADELFFGYTRIPTPLILNQFFDSRFSKNKININGRSLNENQQILQIFRHPNNFSVPILNQKKTLSDLEKFISNNVSTLPSDFPETSKYRWLELMTYVKGDLNNTLDFSSMINSLEVRAPFLDHELIEVALSLDERQHISSKNGRKHFLKEILHEEKVPSEIWDRNKVGFSLIDSYLSSIEKLKDAAVRELENENILKLSPTEGFKDRDISYLRSAALGFYFWKKIWIDSGIVKK
jgi:asparagine synthase (glutamine-hydrolysing)